MHQLTILAHWARHGSVPVRPCSCEALHRWVLSRSLVGAPCRFFGRVTPVSTCFVTVFSDQVRLSRWHPDDLADHPHHAAPLTCLVTFLSGDVQRWETEPHVTWQVIYDLPFHVPTLRPAPP